MPHTSPQLPQGNTRFVPRTSTPETRATFDLSRLLYGSTTPQKLQTEDLLVPDGAVSSSLLVNLRHDWIQSSERAGHSPRTLGEKKAFASRLIALGQDGHWPHVGIEQYARSSTILRTDFSKKAEGLHWGAQMRGPTSRCSKHWDVSIPEGSIKGHPKNHDFMQV